MDLTGYGLPVIVHPDMPQGFILGSHARGSRMFTAPLRFRRDPWPSTGMPEPGRNERRKALDHLAGLLDRMCESLGMDPDAVWRGPKEAEETARTSMFTVIAEERIALTVNPPGRYAKITGV